MVANLDALLDVTDVVGRAEIHAQDVKDVHLDVREAVQGVNHLVVLNVHPHVEMHVADVEIVVIVDVVLDVQIHVQIIV